MGRGRSVTIQGRTFPSLKAAGDHFGVTPQTIAKAVARGTTHRIGCGKPGSEALPVRVHGVTYPSAQAVAKALKVKESTVYDALRLGRPERIGRGPVPIVPAHQRSITIGTRTWPSLMACSRALGFQKSYVGSVLHTKSKRGWERILAAAMALEAKQASADAKAASAEMQRAA